MNEHETAKGEKQIYSTDHPAGTIVTRDDVGATAEGTIRESHPYTMRDDGFYLKAPRRGGGTEEIRLSNFTARITADVRRTDGDHVEKHFDIETRLGDRTDTFTILARQFDGLGWVPTEMGGQAILEPVSGAKRHVATAVRKFSGAISEQMNCCHTGWTPVDGRPLYLTGGGGIGADGYHQNIRLELPDEFKHCNLILPTTTTERVDAFRASLRLLDVGEDVITFPLLAAVYRSVLRPCDFGLFVFGESGRYKSSACALAQQHFGAGFDVPNLPGSFEGTAKALEYLAFTGKDMLTVVDDFIPYKTEMREKARRLFRAQGNASGRARLKGGGKLQSAQGPRGLLVGTGEDLPNGQSVRARVIALAVGLNDICRKRLSTCQTDASRGLYARSMGGFVQWVAGRHADILEGWDDDIATLRRMFGDAGRHRRTPTNLAHLAMGANLFLDWGHEQRAITLVEANKWQHRFMDALKVVANAQGEYQLSSDDAIRFIELLVTAFATGGAHLRKQLGYRPQSAGSWGWHPSGNPFNLVQKGALMGWLGTKNGEDTDDVFLDADLCYQVAQHTAGSADARLKASPRALWKMLDTRGLLVSTEQHLGRGRTTRIQVNGVRKVVIHLRAETFLEFQQSDANEGHEEVSL